MRLCPRASVLANGLCVHALVHLEWLHPTRVLGFMEVILDDNWGENRGGCAALAVWTRR